MNYDSYCFLDPRLTGLYPSLRRRMPFRTSDPDTCSNPKWTSNTLEWPTTLIPNHSSGCLSGHQTQTPVPTQSGPLTHSNGPQPWSQTTLPGLSYAALLAHSSSLTLGDHPFISGFILVPLGEFGHMLASNPILQMSRGNGSKLFCNLHRACAGPYVWDPERGRK